MGAGGAWGCGAAAGGAGVIDIRIDGLDRVQRALQSMTRQAPKAISRAINDTAFKVMAAERVEINTKFDQPKPWVAKNVRVFKATPAKLAATVGATDWFERGGLQPKGTAWNRILAPHVYGGTRLQKASERRLQAAGLLPPGWFTVPGERAKRDHYGNISQGEILALLVWVNAMGQYAGDNTNRRDRQTRRRNAMERRGESYFVVPVGNDRGIQPGIYKRFGRGYHYPILIFVSQVRYRPRLDWYEVGQRAVAAEFPRAFRAAFGNLAGPS